MTSESSIGRSDVDAPPAPNRCEECGSTDFTPHSEPPAGGTKTGQEYVFAYHECAECEEVYNDRRSQLLPSDNIRVPDWREIFGHPEPYEHQVDGIEHCRETALSGGFSVVEGGCGTGKTMIALTAGLNLVKDPRTKYERIMVLTSVKQQLRQFESDLKIINENLPEDVPAAKAVTLVGKTDLCPYAREEKAGIDKSNVNYHCRRLRDQTSKIMSDGQNGSDLSRSAIAQTDREQWSSCGAQSPYSDTIPESKLEYCPFYANYKEHGDPLFTFGHAPDCILHPEEIVKQAVQKGVCPHSAMSVLCRDADVVIANYYHAFDRNTRQITNALIDDTTLLVCDEAHMLEPRVRGIMSTSASVYGLGKAADEVAAVYNAVSPSKIPDVDVREPPRGVAVEHLAESPIGEDLLRDVHNVLQRVETTIDKNVTSFLDANHAGWRQNPGELESRIEVPLRDPTKIEMDSLTKWANEQGIPDEMWEFLPNIADLVGETLSDASENGGSNHQIEEIAQLFDEWFKRDNTTYFREITLRKRDDARSGVNSWKAQFSADIEIHSVMPRKKIGWTVNDFGGGILMSATLAPMDVYKEVTGLDFLSALKGRLVTERMYSADFPKERRLSMTLDLPKFTYGNRGDITENTDTRKQYAKAILELARTTPGNVLVCMPSYREAGWAAQLLKQTNHVSKEILLDESSGEKATQRLKQRFIDGGGKVLVTSLRGTLTEGVDFDGDKCLAAIVCGVPIENVGSPKTKAVRTAYEDEFGGIGFDYGLTVPAVRKTRQALGRVIRNTEDVGVRVIADGRYAGNSRNSVRHYLSEDEQEEYDVVDDLGTYKSELQNFWNQWD